MNWNFSNEDSVHSPQVTATYFMDVDLPIPPPAEMHNNFKLKQKKTPIISVQIDSRPGNSVMNFYGELDLYKCKERRQAEKYS